MKPGYSLLLALLLPPFFCFAQGDPPAVQPAAQAPASPQSALEPGAQDPVLSAVKDAEKKAEADKAKQSAEEAATWAARDANRPVMDDSYVIGPLDTLSVVVWREEGLTDKGALVRPDGMITLPLVGDIKASGKTPMQLAKEITEQLKKFVQDPSVTVSLDQMNSKKVFLMGEVAKEGPITLLPGMTLLEAIGSAGGLTQFANTRKMYILRITDGKQQKILVEYKQALKGDHSLNLNLNAGDTIVVP